MSPYLRPACLEEALERLSEGAHTILAGATDLYPADANAVGWGKPGLGNSKRLPILDISAVPRLDRIEQFDDRIELGALVTWAETLRCALPAWFDGVRLAAREVGGRQIQNRGTLAGNLCNASPAADGVPALLSLDARVRLQKRGAEREIPLDAFITGNRRTCREADELLTAIIIATPPASSKATFLKLGARRYLVISIAMVAAWIDVRDELISEARIAVGACSEVALRLRDLEARLVGAPASAAGAQVRASDFEALSPITDVRASASYRLHGARILVERALRLLVADGRAAGSAA